MADRVRLLGKTGGYTDKSYRAMDATEPEAVDAETQARISKEAKQSQSQREVLHVAERTVQPLDKRIALAKAQAKFLGLNVHQHVRLCRLAIEGGRSREAVERRVEALERAVWPQQ